MLDKQYNIYSVDTGHFYSNHEKYLHDMNCKYRQERNYLKNKQKNLISKLKSFGYDDEDIQYMDRQNSRWNNLNSSLVEESEKCVMEYINICDLSFSLTKYRRMKLQMGKTIYVPSEKKMLTIQMLYQFLILLLAEQWA